MTDTGIEWVVESILGERRVGQGRGRVEYLVKWKGYEEHDATWEPASNLVDNEGLQEYLSRQAHHHHTY